MDFFAALIEGGGRRELVAVGSCPDGAAQLGVRTMLTVSEMLCLAENKRDKAERARRWLSLMATPEDQRRLLVFAQELENEADELERRACLLTAEMVASAKHRQAQQPTASLGGVAGIPRARQ